MMKRILIIDDDEAVRKSLSLLLRQEGFSSAAAADPESALGMLSDSRFHLVILDMNFSRQTTGEEGLDLLMNIKQRQPSVPVVLITAWGSIELAVEGMKAGADDFINKPWDNRHLMQSIQTLLAISIPQDDTTGLSGNRQKLDQRYCFEKLIGAEPVFLEILRTVGRIADTNASVLISGESGTGKELIAEAIHENSARNSSAFVKVNLGGISTGLFESEMFGHVKGAFTDARSDRKGRFETADGGSIFLDEIGELDPYCQVKLLRVLQDRSFERLGSSTAVNVDVRVISATNRPLEEMVESGRFREDLYYRINLIQIKLPALRQRRNDIPLLVNSFLEKLKKIYHRPELRLTQDCYAWLQDMNWPGNIRELKNLVERTILMNSGNLIRQSDFLKQHKIGVSVHSGPDLPDVGTMTLEEMELQMIRKAMDYHHDNVSQVACSLGISRAALYRRLEKYKISHSS